MASERSAIKVGTGYIEIVPKILQKDVQELRAGIQRQIAGIGSDAGKSVAKGITDGLKKLPQEAKEAAKKAERLINAESEKASNARRKIAADEAKAKAKVHKDEADAWAKRERERTRKAESNARMRLDKVKEANRKAIADDNNATKLQLANIQAVTRKHATDTNARIAKDREANKAKIAADNNATKIQLENIKDATSRHRIFVAQQIAGANRLSRERIAADREANRVAIEAQKDLTQRHKIATDQRLAQTREANRLAIADQREQTRLAIADQRDQTDRYKAELRARNEAHKAMIRAVVMREREAMQANVANIRAQAAAQRAALQSQLDTTNQSIETLRSRLAAARGQIQNTTTTTRSFFQATETNLRKMGTWFDQVGMHITEAGNILATRFLAPLAAAGTALTTIGVKSADTRLLGQLGLSASGVDQRTSGNLMAEIQQYAIDTPFSVDIMHEYQMKMIRSLAGSDKDWYKESTRTGAANKAAGKATDLIMAIGDSMARAGNLNPQQFQRAMYAMDMIMDMDRAPTKNVRQLIASTGIPAAELAMLLGFKDSEEMYKVMGTPAAKGGGITGTSIASAMLNYWDPNKYEGDVKTDGSRGYAESMTNATISGRLQQMKEQAVFDLGNLFASDDNPDGEYRYTKLGEALMGKETLVRGQWNKELGDYEYSKQYEGGILQQVQEMYDKYSPDIETFLSKFLESVSKFITVLDQAAQFIKDSGLAEFASSVANFLLEWGPYLLAAGLAAKVGGKVLGLAGRAVTPLRAAGRGALNTWDAGQDVRSQRRARSDAREQARSQGLSRQQVTEAGRQAYRDQRTRNRGGDDRTAGRRILDALTGRNTQERQQRQANYNQQQNIDALRRQLDQAQSSAGNLRDAIRGINDQTTRDVQDELARGHQSIANAAQQAANAIGQIQTGLNNVNGANLTSLDQDLDRLKKAAEEIAKSLDKAKTSANQLGGESLSTVTQEAKNLSQAADNAQKMVDNTKGSVENLARQTLGPINDDVAKLRDIADQAGKNITSANTRVNNLNGKTVSALTQSVDELRDSAKKAADQIGDGAMASSASGRTANLNKRRLTDVIAEFKKLTASANDAYEKVGQGTGAGSLAGRIGLLNNRSVKSLTGQVEDLAEALEDAKGEAGGLNTQLGNIQSKGVGGTGGGGGGRNNGKNNARGGNVTQTDVKRYGTLPGYSPWVDNIPAMLSPGEAVLRPEVASAIGPTTIDAWNQAAVRGQIVRHARGTSGDDDSGVMASIQRLADINSLGIDGLALRQTMKMDNSSDAVGGTPQGGILRTGDSGARFTGTDIAGKFRGAYDWLSQDLWQVAKKAPTIVGQVAGILGGAVAPVAGEHFWNDVWKGSGNVIDRGNRWMDHMFSMETLSRVWTDLYTGVFDSVGAIWDTVTNPIDSINDAVSGIGNYFSTSYNNFVDMVEVMKEIEESPSAYAGRVYKETMTTAKEAMPNTKGLFDFEKGSKISAPEIEDMAQLIIEPGSGTGVQRWSPVVRQALAMLGLPQSDLGLVLHRIGVESGGNPNIVNKWDSNWKMGHPSVGLMQVIGPTYQRWAGPFKKTGPFLYGTSTNPLANIYAGLNYATNTYGNWRKALSGTKGYAAGTLSASPGLHLVGEQGPELVDFKGGERVYDNAETQDLLLNGRKYEIHIHEAKNEPTSAAVLRALQQAEALFTPL